MKRFKKMLTMGLAAAMAMTAMSISAMAEENATQSSLYDYYDKLNTYNTGLSLSDFLDVAQYAYLDLESATSAMKETIINSREYIISNTTWTVNNLCWTYEDGEKVVLPDFYDLFPSDWDLPSEQYSSTEISFFADSMRTTTLFNDSVYISAPITGKLTANFHEWKFAFPHYTTVKATSIPGTTYNVGFTTNGVSVGVLTGQTINSQGLTCYLSAAEGDVHGARVSTNSTTGTGNMVITYE